MMHRCSSGCGHGNMVGHCSCGGAASSAAFSMFLSMPNSNHSQCYKTSAAFHNDDENMYSFASPPASVDCTLSLATPSTRRFNENEKRGERRLSNFCWDILQPSKPPPPSAHKSATATVAADSIVPRRCANCDTTSTPLWRNGPRGPKSLCNACGIRFKKEERRASAAAATATCAAAGGVGIESQHMINTSWVHHHHHHTQAQKMGYYSSAYGNEFRFIDDDHRDSDAGAIPFISWRLSNVADRSSLVHDFTR